FIICRVWRMAAIAHRFKRLIDLAECGLGHGSVPPPLGKEHQGDTFSAKTPSPVKRHALAGLFFQRLAKGDNGLFELRRSAFALSKIEKRTTQIALLLGPNERRAVAGPYLQHLAKGDNGLFEFRRPGLSLSERFQRKAQIILGRGPIVRLALARKFLERLAKGDNGLFEFRRPGLSLSEL